jgi:hypothetical protein
MTCERPDTLNGNSRHEQQKLFLKLQCRAFFTVSLMNVQRRRRACMSACFVSGTVAFNKVPRNNYVHFTTLIRRVLIFLLFLVGWDWFSWYCGHYWPIVPAPDDRWGWLWRNWWNENWRGKPKYSEKTFPSATSSTTNPTWLDPGLNPGRRGGRPATKRLSYGAA